MIDDDETSAEDAKPDDIIEEALEAFKLASEAEQDNRRNALEDIRFVDLLEQWPEKVRKDRETDGRPCLTIDKIGPVIRQVVNDGRQNKPSIKVHPVDDDADVETAQIFAGLIRNIEVSSNADVAYDTAGSFAIKGGLGYFRINTAYASDDTFDQDLVIERVANPFSVYGDPHSTAADSSDWNTSFIIDQMAKSAFAKRWKGAKKVDWNADGYTRLSAPWWEGETVAVAEYWTRDEIRKSIALLTAPNIDALTNDAALSQFDALTPPSGIVDLKVYEANKALYDALGVQIQGKPREVLSHKVTQRIMSGIEVLETVEWAGVYIPIIPVYGDEAWVENTRHLRGIVRAAKDPQRMFNYWRSMTTELVALAPKAPWIGAVGQFDTDAQKWATANTQNWDHIEYDPVGGAGPPQRQAFAGVPAGALQEAMNASDDIKAVTGIYDASLGARSNETSGRAILARQREGDVSTFHYSDNLARALRHAGRILVDLIPKVYSAPRVIRIMGVDGKPENVAVNQPTTVKQKDPRTGQMADIERIYDLGAGKYDITVESGPSFTTQREEAASQMMELLRVYPQAAPVIGDLLAKNLDWPGAEEIAERLHAILPPELRGEDPAGQAAQQQIAHMGELLKTIKQQLDDKAAAQELNERKVDIDAFNAETARLKIQQPAMSPEQVQTLVFQTLHDMLSAAPISEPEQEQPNEAAEYAPPPAAGGGMMLPPGQPPAPPTMPPPPQGPGEQEEF